MEMNVMAERTRFLSFVVFCLVAVVVVSWSVYPWAEAQEGPNWHKGLPKQYKSKWLVHDLKRPKPEVVTQAGPVGSAPSDATVLFDGKDLSQWTKGNGKPAAWAVKDGYAELNNTGNIQTKKEFGDCQFHIEWRAPAKPRGVSQARGNSGIFFMGLYEVQIMDSFNNATYADGSAASIYGQHPPLVNARLMYGMPNISLVFCQRQIFVFFPIASGLTFHAKLDIASGLWL